MYSPIPSILKILHTKIFKFSTTTGLRFHFEYLGTVGREILKQILKKQDGRYGHSSDSWQRLIVGSCAYGHENFRLHTITGIQIDEQQQTSQKGLPSM
jgi:hypothetical protein